MRACADLRLKPACTHYCTTRVVLPAFSSPGLSVREKERGGEDSIRERGGGVDSIRDREREGDGSIRDKEREGDDSIREREGRR